MEKEDVEIDYQTLLTEQLEAIIQHPIQVSRSALVLAQNCPNIDLLTAFILQDNTDVKNRMKKYLRKATAQGNTQGTNKSVTGQDFLQRVSDSMDRNLFSKKLKDKLPEYKVHLMGELATTTDIEKRKAITTKIKACQILDCPQQLSIPEIMKIIFSQPEIEIPEIEQQQILPEITTDQKKCLEDFTTAFAEVVKELNQQQTEKPPASCYSGIGYLLRTASRRGL